MKTTTLPAAFQDLQAFVSDWALPNEKARYHKLMHTELSDLRIFFDAMLPRASDIIALLEPHDPDALQGELLTLYQLLATFVETAHPIELNWKNTDIEFKSDPMRLQFHGPSAAY
jgi:hypothetical protein